MDQKRDDLHSQNSQTKTQTGKGKLSVYQIIALFVLSNICVICILVLIYLLF